MAICWCGREAIIRTSWTSQNPGRRFYSCPQQGSKCRFVGWFDPPMCPRAVDIIPGLLRSKNVLEGRVKEAKNEARRWKLLLYYSWIAFVMVFVWFVFL